MLAIFSYYITDAAWGIFAGLNNIPLLFVDTTIYYVAMAAAVVCWCQYIISYLAKPIDISKLLSVLSTFKKR